jgi:hypothetical protein
MVFVYGVLRHFQQYFSYIMVVSFICGGKRRKPLTRGELRFSGRYGIHCQKNTWMYFRSNSRINYFPLQV